MGSLQTTNPMRFSQMLIPTLRDTPADAEVISHQLMIRAGMIRKIAAGVYTYLPLGLRVIKKVEKIVREELNAAGAQELLLPIVMPKELWEETGRWGVYGKELLRFQDRSERWFCFGPTHEEAITDLVRNEVRSWRQLPLNLYQIQTKFRDEMRPRFGLMRGREFIMKDCYSFDLNEAASLQTYGKMVEAYKKIFARCGLKFRPVEAGTGEIGGTLSHEFHVLAKSGEDEIFYCEQCDYAASAEKVTATRQCPKCKVALLSARGIEVGQVFFLGTKYSEKMHAVYLDDKGKENLIVMGCYGIGIGRTAAAAIEQNHDEKGICWPAAIAPFHVTLLVAGQMTDEIKGIVDGLYRDLGNAGIEVLYDDRDESAGTKFKDAELIGIPFQVIVGARSLKAGGVEFKSRKDGTSEIVAKEKLISHLQEQLS